MGENRKNLKEPKTFEEQLKILKSRNCIIEDDNFALKKISLVNYYRLSAYFLPFKTESEKYKPGTSFNRICRIYDFDKNLRRIIFDAIEEIEIFLRCQLSYFFSHKYGTLGYLEKDNFSNKHKHDKFLQHINLEIEQNKNVLFVKHHIENYGGQFPLWVLIEIFTFGMLSFFFKDLKTEDQKKLAGDLFKTTFKNTASRIHCCSILRNICAHYGRIYFRTFPFVPSGIKCEESAKRKIWTQILSIKSLFPDKQKWNACFVTKIKTLFGEYESDIELSAVGFPQDWKAQIAE